MSANPTETPKHCVPETPEEVSRRKFLERLSIALFGIGSLILCVPMVGFIVAPLFKKRPEVWRDVGPVDNFKKGTTTSVVFKDAAALPWAGVASKTAAWLRRLDDGSFIAFSINCTHLGCPVRWMADAELFMCPCHGGVYYANGAVAAGPPPLPLPRYQVRVRDGKGTNSHEPNADHRLKHFMVKRFLKAIWDWIDDRTGLAEMIMPLMRHLAPRDAKWWYVFGSATMCAFMIQVVSGVALAFAYIPSTNDAYATLQFITEHAPFGNFLRALHYYGASAMVLMVGAHMAQVFLFGSYKFPRELNWATGVLLLGFTLVMGFTGQLLRWDQTAVWSVVVAAEQAGRVPFIGHWLARFTLGGDTVGGATLNRFFVIHVFIMPALIFAFIGLHLLLVFRHGISEPPTPGKPVNPKTYRKEYEELLKTTGKPFWPDAAWRDVVFCVAMIVVMTVLALALGPPTLGKPPDPSIVGANPRPDWYLLWYFAVLALLPHGTEQYFMIFGPLLAGMILILLPFVSGRGERSARRRPWSIAACIMIVIMIGTLWVAGAKSKWSPNFAAEPLSAAVVGATTGPVSDGAHLFFAKGCLNCHLIDTDGGRRGPDLTAIGSLLTRDQIILRIANGGINMPAYAAQLSRKEMDDLATFLQSRKIKSQQPLPVQAPAKF